MLADRIQKIQKIQPLYPLRLMQTDDIRKFLVSKRNINQTDKSGVQKRVLVVGDTKSPQSGCVSSENILVESRFR